MINFVVPLVLIILVCNNECSLNVGCTIIVMASMFLLTPYISSTYYTINGINNSLIVLTLWIGALILVVVDTYSINTVWYLRSVLILIITLIIAFTANNLLTFYILFELSLLPTVSLLIIWGGQPERLNASIYIIIYTIVFSFILLFIIFYLYEKQGHIYIDNNYMMHHGGNECATLNTLILVPFLVNIPIYGLHLWLPNAHVEAPVAGSIILAAILLNLGGYGIMRITHIMPYVTTTDVNTLLCVISLFGTLYTCIICLNQTDINALVAYSSITHIGPVVIALLSITESGCNAAYLIIIAHGLSSSALFTLVNISYEESGSRSLALNNGAILIAPGLALLWLCVVLTNISTPPSLNFIGEIMIIPSIILPTPWFGTIIFTYVILTGAYNLYLYTSVVHGNPNLYLPNPSQPNVNSYTLIILHLMPLLLLTLNTDIII